jgi:hypothetical protein
MQKPDDFLEHLNADQLRHLIRKLWEQKPELKGWFESMVNTDSQSKTRVQLDTKTFRRQVKQAVGQIDYRKHWQSIHSVVHHLDKAQTQARNILQQGDFSNALTLIRIIGEEVIPGYGELEEETQLSEFLETWSEDLTEAILGADLSDGERESLSKQVNDWSAELADYGFKEILYDSVTACKYGWDTPEEDDLTIPKLNVLEYRNDTETYLKACLEYNAHYRYAKRLIELGKIDEAVAHALQYPLNINSSGDEYLILAKFLQEQGLSELAYQIGVKGLSGEKQGVLLASWVAELAEKSGWTERSRQAWQIAFNQSPSLEAYQKLKRLSGDNWLELRPQLIAKTEERGDKTVLIEIAIEDGDIDKAVAVWDSYKYGNYQLLEKLVNVAAETYPDWSAAQALEEAKKLILKGSSYYPHAVRWLQTVKNIYLQHNRSREWQQCLDAVKVEHGRKYSLMAQLKSL